MENRLPIDSFLFLNPRASLHQCKAFLILSCMAGREIHSAGFVKMVGGHCCPRMVSRPVCTVQMLREMPDYFLIAIVIVC